MLHIGHQNIHENVGFSSDAENSLTLGGPYPLIDGYLNFSFKHLFTR